MTKPPANGPVPLGPVYTADPPPVFGPLLPSAQAGGLSSDAGAAGPVQSCQAATQVSKYEPCDVDSLQLVNTTDKQTVQATTTAARDGGLSDAQRALLGSDDLLLQLVADYHRDGHYDVSKMKKGKIVLTGMTSPPCPDNQHGLMTWRGATPSGIAGTPKTWVMSSPPVQEVLAQSTRAFSGSGGFLKPFWSFGSDRMASFQATIESCGVRDGAEATHALSGRVEVYPNDTFELTVKIPPFRKITKSEAASRSLTSGDKTRSSRRGDSRNFGRDGATKDWDYTTNQRTGDQHGSQSSSTTRGGVTETDTFKGGRKGGEETSETGFSVAERGLFGTRTETVTQAGGSDVVEFTDKSTVSTAISLKHNGVELDITKSINSVVALARDIKTTFDNFKNAVPKIGWQADLDISILEGSITGRWGVTPTPKPEHARIWMVQSFYELQVDVKIFYIKAEIGFGVDFKIENWFSSNPLLEVVFKITGSLTLDVPLKATFSSGKPENVAAELSGTTTPKLEAVARASALGYTANASIDISCGFKASGNFKCGFEVAPICEAKLEWLPIRITAQVSYPGSRPWQGEIFKWPDGDIKPIWQGKLPNTPTAR